MTRRKNGLDGVHPLAGIELRQLRKLRRDNPHASYVFLSEGEGGVPASPAGFRKMLSRTAEAAGLGALRVHPHMLRHATGYALVNKGTDTRTLQAYMGHASISSTVVYTALSAERFNGLWKD